MSRVTTDQSFEKEVLEAKGVSVVDFWAEWCGPCRALGPTIDEVSRELAGKVEVFKLDVDANPETPERYNIRGIPTVLVFKNGLLVDQLVGVQPKGKILSTISKHND